MDSVDIPSFFICPISLQVMKDPVTISTGMTFDRESIQKWLFFYNHTTCPITNQPLSDFSLIPNSNLLRLIQSWKLQHRPPPPPSDHQNPDHEASSSVSYIILLLEEIKHPHSQVKSLRKIKNLIQEKHRSLLFLGDDVIFSSIVKSLSDLPVDEAVSVLSLLKPSDQTLKIVSENENGVLICSLCEIMTKHLQNEVRTHIAILLKSIFKVVDKIYKAELKADFFETIAEILKDQNSKNGSLAVLNILIEVLPFGKNKENAIRGGCVPILVELLGENTERRSCEMMLVVLEKLCRKAEGRAAFLGHPIGIAAVLSKILRVSQIGNDKAISLLVLVFRFCKSKEVAQEFIEVGGVAKVFMVVQSGCDSKIKNKANEILGFHKNIWRKSPCFPSSLKI